MGRKWAQVLFLTLWIPAFVAVPSGIPGPLRAADDYAWLGEPKPDWFPRVLGILQARKGWRYELDQGGLFKGEADRLYLVLNWTRHLSDEPRNTEAILEFHGVTVSADGEVHLKVLREMRDYILSFGLLISEPGKAPMLTVDYDSGGSQSLENGTKIIRLARNTIDVTPDEYGITKLVTADPVKVNLWDGRWATLFWTGRMGTVVLVVLDYSKGEFVPACKSHPADYTDFFDSDDGGAVDAGLPERPDRVKAESIAQRLLNHIQLGMLDEARSEYAELHAFMATSDLDKELVEYIDGTFPNLLERAQHHLDAPCVLAAIEP